MALLCLLPSCPAMALELRAYDPTLHDRFLDFPEDPSFNPSFPLDYEQLTGIGWESGNSQKQYALISPCHAVFAAHNAPAIGSRISFLSTSGSIVERSVSRTQSITNPWMSTSDVLLVTLSSPIDRDEGVEPLPYLNLSSEEDYAGLPLVVFGSQAKAGEGTVIDFTTINVNWIVSRTYRFNYTSTDGGSGDARLASGDSGSPSLVNYEGKPSLLGIHLATSNEGDVQSNYDAFLPLYVDQIDAIIASDGFRMRPRVTGQSNLTCASWLASPVAIQGKALELGFALTHNSGIETGNLELDLRFTEATAPDAIEAEGWVVSGGGTHWTLRRALLEGRVAPVVRAQWDAAPLVDSFQPDIRWVSDSSEEGTMAISVDLAPSFNSWAHEFGEADEMADPDGDLMPNIIEYAFGRDPLISSSAQAAGTPPPPTFVIENGIATYSHPERTDMDERKLSYVAEWSNSMKSGSWSPTEPVGFSTSTTPYLPDIPGFTKRQLSWPVQGGHQFIRLNIEEIP
ncbi:hypothetical protein [Haloferula sp.]|uniref:hypothetical protein n=1 Tax=Haloferula sp. TaxID=2497595 RepID=UPI00329C6F3B